MTNRYFPLNHKSIEESYSKIEFSDDSDFEEKPSMGDTAILKKKAKALRVKNIV
jgi:hypothetical protein